MQIHVRKNASVVHSAKCNGFFFLIFCITTLCSGYGITLTPASAKPSNQLYSEISPDNAISKSDKRVSVWILNIAQVYTLYSPKKYIYLCWTCVIFLFAVITDVNFTFRLM